MPKLSISKPNSFQDVVNVGNEFGPSTFDALPGDGLLQFWQKIFGTGTKNNRFLDDFNGYGQPRINTLPAQFVSCSGGTVTVRLRAEITDMGGLDCHYRFYWDTSAVYSNNPQYTHTVANAPVEPASSGDGVIVTADIQVAVNSDVYYRGATWNAFNDGAVSDHYLEPASSDESYFTAKQALATPSITDTGKNGFTDIYVGFSHDSNSPDVQYNWWNETVEGSAPTSSDTGTQVTNILCENNLGTANAKASLRTNGYNSNDNIWIKVRALGNDCYNHSAWSNWVQVGTNMLNPC